MCAHMYTYVCTCEEQIMKPVKWHRNMFHSKVNYRTSVML